MFLLPAFFFLVFFWSVRRLGLSRGDLWTLLGHIGPSWVRLGSLLGPLGSVLEPSGTILGSIFGSFGVIFWSFFGLLSETSKNLVFGRLPPRG